jgi:hypothetical protein
MANINTQVGELLRDLPSVAEPRQRATTQEQPSSLAGERISIDPLTYLLPPAAVKCLEIVNFVQFDAHEVEEELWENGESKVVLKSGVKKTKLENVTPMQWSAANIKIMFELVRQEKLQPANIWDYLAYTVKVSEMTAIYKWDSVLRYDQAYRRAQAAMGFRWASDSPYVDKMYLRFREEKLPTKGQRKGPQEQKICKAYQKGNCQFGRECWHKHICNIQGCGQKHPRSQHPPASGNEEGRD